ncbi:MAG: C40 family peptidase, partial [Bacteroidales bacterium]|nr:C40 family peptidase [Bacteroidales bacterium]
HALTEFLNENNITYKDSINMLPDESVGIHSWGLVTLSVANLRTQARHSSEMATQAIMGTPVKVFKESGGWLYVQTPDKYLAWTNSSAVQTIDNDQLQTWKNSKRVIYLSDFGMVFSEPSKESLPVSDIVMGSILLFDNTSDGFFHVILPDGRSGYLPDNECTDFNKWNESVTPLAKSMESIGRIMMGRPYLWGGTSVKGFDCSGFVKSIYFMNGLILSRDASQQVYQGVAVNTKNNFSELQAGDLLYFGRKASKEKSERITHVGMYIGDGKFIHSSGRVKINSFNKSDSDYRQYLVDIFVRARRMINIAPAKSPITILQHKWYY